MAKKEIKAHKGGRTKTVPVRLNPEIWEYLQRNNKINRMSFGDWITAMAKAEISAQFNEFKGVEVEASDNGQNFDLAWALELMTLYGLDTPISRGIDPREVRWLAGKEAREEWEHMKADGWPSLENWTDEQPYISWMK